MAQDYDVVIVGGGAAGLTAGMYCAHYGLKTAIIERLMGGAQIINAEMIENFPGFPQGISGAELGPLLQEQATGAGAQVILAEASRVGRDGDYRVVSTDDGDYRGRAVILAAGSSLKRLGIPGEDEYTGKGVSHCATCDGPLFAKQVVGVVGGGDTAADEALSLTSYVDHIFLFHRRDRFRAQHVLQERLLSHPKIEVIWNTVVERILGEETLTGVQIRNVITNLENRVSLSGMFIYVGLEPNSSLIQGVLKVDNAGHIPINPWMEAAVPGILAAGDIRQHSAAQLVSAAGDGATAALAAFRYITSRQWPR